MATKSSPHSSLRANGPLVAARSSMMDGTVMSDLAVDLSIRAKTDSAVGILVGEGQQHGFPTESERAGARTPKP